MVNLKREITEYAFEYMKANEKKLNGFWSEYWEIYTSKGNFTKEVQQQRYSKSIWSGDTYHHFDNKTVDDNAANVAFNAENRKKLEKISEKFIDKLSEEIILDLYTNPQFTQKYNLNDALTLRTAKSCLVNLLEEYIGFGNKNVNEVNNRKRQLEQQMYISRAKVEKMFMKYKNNFRIWSWIFFGVFIFTFIILLVAYIVPLMTAHLDVRNDYDYDYVPYDAQHFQLNFLYGAIVTGILAILVFLPMVINSYKSKKRKQKHFEKVNDILKSKTEYTEKEQKLVNALYGDQNLGNKLKKQFGELSILNNFIDYVRNEL